MVIRRTFVYFTLDILQIFCLVRQLTYMHTQIQYTHVPYSMERADFARRRRGVLIIYEGNFGRSDNPPSVIFRKLSLEGVPSIYTTGESGSGLETTQLSPVNRARRPVSSKLIAA